MGLKSNKKFIIGVDEAGRGPLAGPITIGAIVIGPLNSRPAKGGARFAREARRAKRDGKIKNSKRYKRFKKINT